MVRSVAENGSFRQVRLIQEAERLGMKIPDHLKRSRTAKGSGTTK